MRVLHILGVYIWRQFLECLTWRGFLFTLVINQAITPLIGLAIWSAILPGSSVITSYYVALLVVQLMTASYENHTFSNGIYGGSLSQDLLRPQPVVVGLLAMNLAMRCWHLLMGVPFIVLSALIVGTSFRVDAVLLALPALALAAALRFLFTYLLALTALWTQRAHSIVGAGETLIFLLGGSAAPLLFFPAGLRVCGEVLPFRYMLGFPAEVASGSLNGVQVLSGYGWQALWLLILILVAFSAWRAGVRRYTAIGG